MCKPFSQQIQLIVKLNLKWTVSIHKLQLKPTQSKFKMYRKPPQQMSKLFKQQVPWSPRPYLKSHALRLKPSSKPSQWTPRLLLIPKVHSLKHPDLNSKNLLFKHHHHNFKSLVFKCRHFSKILGSKRWSSNQRPVPKRKNKRNLPRLESNGSFKKTPTSILTSA